MDLIINNLSMLKGKLLVIKCTFSPPNLIPVFQPHSSKPCNKLYNNFFNLSILS